MERTYLCYCSYPAVVKSGIGSPGDGPVASSSVANSLIGRLAPADHQGAAHGLTFSATAVGSFLGPLLGGAVASTLGLRWVFVTTAGLLALNTLWVSLRVRSRLPSGQERAPGLG